MSKKDYIAIAEVLNANHATLETVLDMADMLEDDNERFDRDRFVRASTGNLRDSAAHLLRRLAV
jgi:hypothetical protein